MNVEINIELIAKCLANNRESQRRLYDTLLPHLNIICRRYLANESNLKDVLQETFVNIFRNLNQFDIQKATFKTWSTKIAINSCLKNNIKNKRNYTEELIINLHEPKALPEAIENLTNEELIQWLKQMPKQYFEVFNMYVIDGFSHPEIAEILGIEESLSRKRLSRSRAWLKKKLPHDFRSQFNFSFS